MLKQANLACMLGILLVVEEKSRKRFIHWKNTRSEKLANQQKLKKYLRAKKKTSVLDSISNNE